MKKKILVILGAVVILAAIAVAVAVFLFMRGPDLSAYEKYREPTLLTMAEERMLVVPFVGSPDTALGPAMTTLFQTYYQLEGVTRSFTPPAPRGRWLAGVDTPKEQWAGQIALPVPAAVVSLPAEAAQLQPAPRLESWTYGEVAQILHVGPYEQEKPTIDRLHAFIKTAGREIAGPHEEEYLRGPGLFGQGDPATYYTLIRYPVKQTAP